MTHLETRQTSEAKHSTSPPIVNVRPAKSGRLPPNPPDASSIPPVSSRRFQSFPRLTPNALIAPAGSRILLASHHRLSRNLHGSETSVDPSRNLPRRRIGSLRSATCWPGSCARSPATPSAGRSSPSQAAIVRHYKWRQGDLRSWSRYRDRGTASKDEAPIGQTIRNEAAAEFRKNVLKRQQV